MENARKLFTNCGTYSKSFGQLSWPAMENVFGFANEHFNMIIIFIIYCFNKVVEIEVTGITYIHSHLCD